MVSDLFFFLTREKETLSNRVIYNFFSDEIHSKFKYQSSNISWRQNEIVPKLRAHKKVATRTNSRAT